MYYFEDGYMRWRRMYVSGTYLIHHDFFLPSSHSIPSWRTPSFDYYTSITTADRKVAGKLVIA
jgi:hypothetical protein